MDKIKDWYTKQLMQDIIMNTIPFEEKPIPSPSSSIPHLNLFSVYFPRFWGIAINRRVGHGDPNNDLFVSRKGCDKNLVEKAKQDKEIQKILNPITNPRWTTYLIRQKHRLEAKREKNRRLKPLDTENFKYEVEEDWTENWILGKEREGK